MTKIAFNFFFGIPIGNGEHQLAWPVNDDVFFLVEERFAHKDLLPVVGGDNYGKVVQLSYVYSSRKGPLPWPWDPKYPTDGGANLPYADVGTSKNALDKLEKLDASFPIVVARQCIESDLAKSLSTDALSLADNEMRQFSKNPDVNRAHGEKAIDHIESYLLKQGIPCLELLEAALPEGLPRKATCATDALWFPLGWYKKLVFGFLWVRNT